MSRSLPRMASTPELRPRRPQGWTDEATPEDAFLMRHAPHMPTSPLPSKPVASSSTHGALAAGTALTEDALRAHQLGEEALRRNQKQRRRAATVPRDGAENFRPSEHALLQGSRSRLASETHLRPPLGNLPQAQAPPPPLPPQPPLAGKTRQRSRTLEQYPLEDSYGFESSLGSWEATSSLGGSSKTKTPRFELYQPVTVTVEKKSPLPWSKEKKSKQHRAIIVDCLDAYTYSVRIIPKSYPALAAQYYRWHWFHGDRQRAIKEGAEAHKADKWELVEKLHISQIVRASKKVILDL